MEEGIKPEEVIAEMERWDEKHTQYWHAVATGRLIDHMREWFEGRKPKKEEDDSFACCAGPTRKGEHRHWCQKWARKQ